MEINKLARAYVPHFGIGIETAKLAVMCCDGLIFTDVHR
jgi:hypothetical protein